MRNIGSWLDRRPGVGAPWIIAHRGASAFAPENSPEAFEAAIACGADAIETDVRVTRDGHFVCHHDSDLLRISGASHAIAELDLSELHRLARLPIVPLESVLEQIHGRCRLLLDLKISVGDDIRRLGAVLSPFAGGGTIAVGVRSLAAQTILMESVPQVPLLGLLDGPDQLPAFHEAGGAWARLWEEDATASNISAVQALAMPVVVMVGGQTNESAGRIDPARLEPLIAARPDGIMVNDPTTLSSQRRSGSESSE